MTTNTFNISSELRNYLSADESSLIEEGFYLFKEAKLHMTGFKDFSFAVFPFAKAYEGFLKRIFYDLGFITSLEYRSKHFRVGKVMAPELQRRLRNRSVYKKICDKVGCDLSDDIWYAWKYGRNEIFHYYIDGIKTLSLEEAEKKINLLVRTMEQTYRRLRTDRVRLRLQSFIKPLSYSGNVN